MRKKLWFKLVLLGLQLGSAIWLDVRHNSAAPIFFVVSGIMISQLFD